MCPIILNPFNELPNYYRFSASVALFGGLLKKSSYTQKSTWDELAILAKSSYDPNDVSQTEFLVLIEKAKKIYHKEKKKKKEKTQWTSKKNLICFRTTGLYTQITF